MNRIGYIVTFILVSFFCENEKCFAQVCFIPAVNFGTNAYPYAGTTADFNGDGFADLAVANGSSGDVSILLGTGTGSFGAAVNFTVGTGPQSVCAADLNGDGKVDLAVANQNSNNISVLIGAGNGSFGTATNFAVGNYPISIISADMNGDGFKDLVTANQTSNNISVLLGTGTGGFGTTINHSAGTTPFSVVSADFNVDGKADLAVANYGSNNISILLGAGTGGFSSLANYAVGSQVTSVISADFNGDGKIDLATANSASNNISVLLGNGTGGFGAAANFITGTSPFSVTSADFNGDSKADLAAANFGSNNVSVLLGMGNGSFKAAATFLAKVDPSCVITADLNGDAQADLVVVNDGSNNVSILLNTAPPALSISAVDSICHGGRDTLTAIGAFTSYKWSANAGNVDTNIVVVNPAVSSLYSLTATDINGCTNISSKTVIVLPAFSVASNTDSLCPGSTAVLTASGANTYSWSTGQTTAGISVTPTVTTTYTVSGINALGCAYIDSITQIVKTCVGINHLAEMDKQIIIYPNPTNGKFVIESNSNEKQTAQVFDLSGRLLLSQNINGKTNIDVTFLNEGIYNVSITSTEGVLNKKLIIAK